MKIYSIRAENFGPFKNLEETRLNELSTITGQNDVGKSHILYALETFLDDKMLKANYVYSNINENDKVVIEVAFSCLPEKIELEKGVETTFSDEMLLDSEKRLRIIKVYSKSLYVEDTYIIINDYCNEDFQYLPFSKRDNLIASCKKYNIDIRMYGHSATNKSKREALREKAREMDIEVSEVAVPIRRNLRKLILSLLPQFKLFKTDTNLSLDDEAIHKFLSPIIDLIVEDPKIENVKKSFTDAIEQTLQKEMTVISKKLQLHLGGSLNLDIKLEFLWHKAMTFEIIGRDDHGIEVPIGCRGSGIKRLFMVAFFQYLSENDKKLKDLIFAIEEPENCLHPGLQRELAHSFQKLADSEYQIIITSHSPVFVGVSEVEHLILVERESGCSKTIQYPDINPCMLADQLGIEPADQITGYDACIFVEGPNDIEFWKSIASSLKHNSYIDADFSDKHIGFIFHGGDSLKNWIDLRAMSRINKNFAVVVDSDIKSRQHSISGKKINWKKKCEEQGGKFFILRKREIENYIHPHAIRRSCRNPKEYDEFSDMKKLFGNKVYKLIRDMSCDEILAMDIYYENDVEHHELKEIVESLLTLSDRI